MTIGELPDDVLLAIFDFHVVKYQELYHIVFTGLDTKSKIESWQSLVHVCRRWRCLVFGSPRRLNLQLCCTTRTTTRTAARKSFDIWPALPLLIRGNVSETSVDNVIAELEHSDRICLINLFFRTTPGIEKLWTAMQVPFPELAILCLTFGGLPYVPVLPDSFPIGSAPNLKFLALSFMPFPRIPKLLSSTTHLVVLWLVNIPHSGYISPEAMATCLSMLTKLQTLRLTFESPQSSPDQENQLSPLPTRYIIPALSSFWFKGVNEYLENLLSRIDAPQIYRDKFSTTFFNDIEFDTPELNKFISRTPRLGAYNEVLLIFKKSEALVRLQSHHEPSHHGLIEVKILCRVFDWQLSSLAQICTLSLHPLLTMKDLYIYEDPNSPPDWKDDIETGEWFDLLLPFTTVKNLHLSKQFVPRIVPALQELTEGRTTEVLPTLRNLFLERFQASVPVYEGIRKFVSARQLINHPVALSVWERD